MLRYAAGSSRHRSARVVVRSHAIHSVASSKSHASPPALLPFRRSDFSFLFILYIHYFLSYFSLFYFLLYLLYPLPNVSISLSFPLCVPCVFSFSRDRREDFKEGDLYTIRATANLDVSRSVSTRSATSFRLPRFRSYRPKSLKCPKFPYYLATSAVEPRRKGSFRATPFPYSNCSLHLRHLMNLFTPLPHLRFHLFLLLCKNFQSCLFLDGWIFSCKKIPPFPSSFTNDGGHYFLSLFLVTLPLV